MSSAWKPQELLSERPPGYGDRVRTELIERLEAPLGRVLDVGCARGNGAALLRSRGATHLSGIDPEPEYVAAARSKYDDVVEGSVEEPLPWSAESVDTILCYDVLEHLYNPWQVLQELRRLLRREGRLHISLPNSRHRAFWMPLAFKGTFEYEPSGLRDITHIRFFTRTDAVRMVEEAGFEVCSVEHQAPLSRRSLLVHRITRGWWAELTTVQWIILASPDSPLP